MTDQPLLPVLQLQGSHRDVGLQIGLACAATIQDAASFSHGEIPRDGRTMAEQLKLAAEYRTITAEHLPYLVEELNAVAEASDVDPLRVFAASIEEIWLGAETPAATRGSALASERGRCSDLVCGPPMTANNDVLVGHNNDLDASVEPKLSAIEWAVNDEPRMFTIGIGPWISVGWNDAGLALSGNELSPNDNRVGIPRLLLVREQLRQTTMASAVDAALHPARASAYNTIFATADGQVCNVEGSATSAAITGFGPRGTLVHTNHYVCDSMLRYEDDADYARRSALRFERGTRLLNEASTQGASITGDTLIEMLSDHTNEPDSLCRHPGRETNTKTVFWCVTNARTRHITYGRGNPCAAIAQVFQF